MLSLPLLTKKINNAPKVIVKIASSNQQLNTNPGASPSQNRLIAHTAKQLNNQRKKSLQLNSLIKNHKHKKPRNTQSQSLLLPSVQIYFVLLDTPPTLPHNRKSHIPHQSQTQIHQTATAQTLLLYSGFLSNTALPTPTLIPAPPRGPHSELLIYSNTPQLSAQPINFANTDKTSISELPQPIHTVSNFHDTTHDISLHFDNFHFDPLCSPFSSPTASQMASNPFNPPQGQITNFERLLLQAHWNHSFNIVNSSPSFQNSLLLSFPGTPPIITLSSSSSTPDPDQHCQHCIGKQPDTTRPPSLETITTENNCINGLNKKSLNLIK